MSASDNPRFPPGRQPYDPLIGLRVGALAGGVLGAVGAVITQVEWLILIGGIGGGTVGYLTERNRMRREISRLQEPDDAP